MRLDVEIEETAYVNVISVGEAANEITKHLVEKKVPGVEFISVDADRVAENKKLFRRFGAISGIVVVMGTADSDFELHIMSEISKEAKRLGNLSIGIAIKQECCKNLEFDNGTEKGVAELKKSVDTLVVFPDEGTFGINPENSYRGSSIGVLQKRVEEFLGLITMPVNPKFIFNVKHSDLKIVLEDKGFAYIETASASKISDAIKMTISQLPEKAFDTAEYVLMDIDIPESVGLIEVAESVGDLFNSKECSIYNMNMGCDRDQITVSMLVTGFEDSNELINYNLSELETPNFLKKKL